MQSTALEKVVRFEGADSMVRRERMAERKTVFMNSVNSLLMSIQCCLRDFLVVTCMFSEIAPNSIALAAKLLRLGFVRDLSVWFTAQYEVISSRLG